MYKSHHDVKHCLWQSAPVFDLTDSPRTHYRGKPIPTLIIYTSLLIFLREAFAHFWAITGTVSVNTPQEFALGSPASLRPAKLKLGSGTCPLPVLFPINQTPISIHWLVQIQECRRMASAQVCTTCHTLLMIGRLNSPFKETLTCVISRQICKASTQFTGMRYQWMTGPTRFDGNQPQECLMLTTKMLNGLMKMHNPMLGMLSHH